MPLTFSGTLDRAALLRASDALVDLVASPEVADAWDRESALPGFTVGGVVRHLVSQPECAVEFLRIQPVPPHAETLSLAALYERTDWFHAPVDAAENTSIVDDFNAMSAGRQEHSVAILDQARAELPGAIDGAGPTTYVPWQDCCLATDDFLAVRLMEVVVHADDLAASVGLPRAGVRRRGAAPGARPARDAVRGPARPGRDAPGPGPHGARGRFGQRVRLGASSAPAWPGTLSVAPSSVTPASVSNRSSRPSPTWRRRLVGPEVHDHHDVAAAHREEPGVLVDGAPVAAEVRVGQLRAARGAARRAAGRPRASERAGPRRARTSRASSA